MTTRSMVDLFYGCFYDPEKHELHWANGDQKVRAVLDCNALASDVYVSWQKDDDTWTEEKKMPSLARLSINEGLRLARTLGFGLEDLSSMILDNDLQTVVLEK